MLAGNLALVSAALFTGAAFYINFAEHPARMGLEDQPLLAQWKPSYKRGLIMQLTLVIVGFLLGSFAWWISGRLPFLFGGLFMLANWPWIIPYRGSMDALSRLRSGGFPVTLPWGEFPEQGDEKNSPHIRGRRSRADHMGIFRGLSVSSLPDVRRHELQFQKFLQQTTSGNSRCIENAF